MKLTKCLILQIRNYDCNQLCIYIYIYINIMEMMIESKNEDYLASTTATLKTITIRRITITSGKELNNL